MVDNLLIINCLFVCLFSCFFLTKIWNAFDKLLSFFFHRIAQARTIELFQLLSTF